MVREELARSLALKQRVTMLGGGRHQPGDVSSAGVFAWARLHLIDIRSARLLEAAEPIWIDTSQEQEWALSLSHSNLNTATMPTSKVPHGGV